MLCSHPSSLLCFHPYQRGQSALIAENHRSARSKGVDSFSNSKAPPAATTQANGTLDLIDMDGKLSRASHGKGKRGLR